MRNITLFNDNWKFQLEGKEPETVQIPHTWNAALRSRSLLRDSGFTWSSAA